MQESKHTDSQFGYEELEKHILSTLHSGIYLSPYDIVNIGTELGYDFPLTARDKLFRALFGKAVEDKKILELLDLLSGLIDKRIEIYLQLTERSKAADEAVSQWIDKAKDTDKLIKRVRYG